MRKNKSKLPIRFYCKKRSLSKPFLLFFVLMLSFHVIYAQDKYEKEYRIKEKAVPIKAVEFIKAMKLKNKIKWYKEKGLEDVTIEAKTKHKGSKYSIEFNLAGEIEDVEGKIKWKDIPVSTQSKIVSYLEREHQKTKLTRIQIQFTGQKEQLMEVMIHNQKSNHSLHIKYEIVVKAKTNNKYHDVEYLFSKEGEMEKKSKIIFDNTDNLEY